MLEKSDDPDVAINLWSTASEPGVGFKECSTHYHRCLERWPLKRNLIVNAHQLLRETGESAAALKWLRLACEQDPDDLQLAEALAEALALDGKKTEAVGNMRRFSKLIRNDLHSWMGLGLVHGQLGHLTESAAATKKHYLSIKMNLRAKANLITIYKQIGEFKSAHKLINSLGKEEQQQPDVLKAIADLALLKTTTCSGESPSSCSLPHKTSKPSRTLAELGSQS